MRWLATLTLLVACAGTAPVGEAVNTQEFVFILANGRSFAHILPADWEPQLEGGFIRINDRQRIMAMDVIMIRPRVQLNVDGLTRVRLVRRNESTSASGKYDVWVLSGIQGKIGLDHTQDLVQVAPQTWLRPNDFRLLVER